MVTFICMGAFQEVIFLVNKTSNLFLADVWRYTENSNQWTWIHGPSTTFPPVVRGQKGKLKIDPF